MGTAAASNSTMASNSTLAGASVKKAVAKSNRKLVSEYKKLDFTNPPYTKAPKKAYDLNLKTYKTIIDASEKDVLNRGNPFVFKSAHIKAQFSDALKIPMSGVPPPPEFEPLTPPKPRNNFTHTSQQDAMFIDPPKAEERTIDLTTNPDAQAVKANIGILMFQDKTTLANLQRLDQLSQQVERYPKEFAMAVMSGDIRTGDNEKVNEWLHNYVNGERFKVSKRLIEEDEQGESDRQVDEWIALEKMRDSNETMTEEQKKKLEWFEDPNKTTTYSGLKFADFPKPIGVAKTPAINWAQYGVVGDSLDAVHENILKNIALGNGNYEKPATIATDGSIKDQYGNADPRYMDREAYVAQAAEQDTKKKRKH